MLKFCSSFSLRILFSLKLKKIRFFYYFSTNWHIWWRLKPVFLNSKILKILRFFSWNFCFLKLKKIQIFSHFSMNWHIWRRSRWIFENFQILKIFRFLGNFFFTISTKSGFFSISPWVSIFNDVQHQFSKVWKFFVYLKKLFSKFQKNPGFLVFIHEFF